MEMMYFCMMYVYESICLCVYCMMHILCKSEKTSSEGKNLLFELAAVD